MNDPNEGKSVLLLARETLVSAVPSGAAFLFARAPLIRQTGAPFGQFALFVWNA